MKRFLVAGPILMLVLFVLALLLTTKREMWSNANGIVADRFNGPPMEACDRGLPPDGGISGYFKLPSNPKVRTVSEQKKRAKEASV